PTMKRICAKTRSLSERSLRRSSLRACTAASRLCAATWLIPAAWPGSSTPRGAESCLHLVKPVHPHNDFGTRSLERTRKQEMFSVRGNVVQGDDAAPIVPKKLALEELPPVGAQE